MRTVDLVVAGDGGAARAAVVDALQHGRRVLVVLRDGDTRAGQRLRRCICNAAAADVSQLRIITRSEVVCVDGVDAVEAVIVRHARTGRLSAVNASAFLSFDRSSQPQPAPGTKEPRG